MSQSNSEQVAFHYLGEFVDDAEGYTPHFRNQKALSQARIRWKEVIEQNTELSKVEGRLRVSSEGENAGKHFVVSWIPSEQTDCEEIDLTSEHFLSLWQGKSNKYVPWESIVSIAFVRT